MPATQKEWIKRLQKEGWTLDRGGKHQVKMIKPGQRRSRSRRTSAAPTRRASRRNYDVRPAYSSRGLGPISMIKTMPQPQHLHVNVRHEDDSFWATVDEFPGVLATGDDLDELRESL
jgi:hypothetical protein